MTEPTERHEFQAEVKQLLDLMVHSLYSNKEIFLRELISNASDALDKLRFARLTDDALAGGGALQIRLERDREKRTLSIVDNGIGMSREDVVKNIGTIAHSGTKEFLGALEKAKGQKSEKSAELSPELIGQFGVGFYSAFMVADEVTVLTRKSGAQIATLWRSTGDGSYTLADAERAEPGTTVTLHLKPVDEERGLRDFTDDFVIQDIVKRYSDFVGHPIRMSVWKKDAESADGAQVLEDKTLNSMKAIWDRPKDEVTDEEYTEFYHHISHDWTAPLRSIPVKMEGTFEAYALLYIPAKAPFDLYTAEMRRGLSLYVKRVFVMDECKDLMPSHLRFVRGVVDAHDLPLNVSREILQKDRQLQVIRKNLVKKVLATLAEMKRDDPDAYLGFWRELGPVLKEGLLGFDQKEQDKILDLVLAPSTANAEGLTSLSAYVERMKEGQDAIYFLTGASDESLRKSPLLEQFVDKGYEVLLFSDAVDELWLDRGPKFLDKPFRSIGRGAVELGSEEERKKAADALEEKEKELGDLLGCFRVHLQDEIKEVRLSNRLTSSAACLVSDEEDMSPRMQKILEQMGQKTAKAKRILELNPGHPLLEKLHEVFREKNDDPRLRLYAELLLGQAHLAESGQVPDPAAFNSVISEVMLRGV
jgi:molecular chaperone HtpG